MYLKQNKSHKGIYLTIAHAYRENGKKKERNVKNIGYLDDLKLQYDDPIAHFKQVAKDMTLEKSKDTKVVLTIDKSAIIDTNSPSINVGSAFIYKMIHTLGLPDILGKIQRKHNAEYKFIDILRFLTYNRILTPSSIQEAYNHKTSWIHSFDFEQHDVYRFLSVLTPYKDALIEHMNKSIVDTFGKRDVSRTYYDCTNYYFEINYNDEDEHDEDGNVVSKGLRKKGPCKHNSKKPIVGMGLVLDRKGIPLTYDIYPGNESEKLTLRPNLNRVKKEYMLDKIIIIADWGLNTSDNIFYNNDANDGYIFSKSVKGADKEFKHWALSHDDEPDMENEELQLIKSRIHTYDITVRTDKRNTKQTVIQKQIVYYSKKYAYKAQYERARMIAKAEKLIKNPGNYTRQTSYGASKYVLDIQYDKEGNIIPKDLKLNLEVIEEESKYDGYYSIVTSEIEMETQEIIDAYRGLAKIEDSFKVLKSEFKARPVYLSNKERIASHFLICYISLVIMRLIETLLGDTYSTQRIANSLNKYQAHPFEDNIYLLNYYDEVLEHLSKIYNIDLNKKYQERNELKNIFKI